MRWGDLCLTVTVGLAPFSMQAQNCTPPARPYFEFQVETPAAFIADSVLTPKPFKETRGSRDSTLTLISFVVDTLGQPEVGTFKVIRTMEPALIGDVKAVLPRWKYRPAIIGGCRVPQLVMTVVTR